MAQVEQSIYRGLATDETLEALRQVMMRLLDQITTQVNATLTSPTAATQAQIRDNAVSILAKITSDPPTAAQITALLQPLARDSTLTQVAATLGQIFATLPAAPALDATVAGLRTDTQAITAKLSSDPATQTTLVAVLTAMNAVLAKLPTAPATETTLSALVANTGKAYGSTKDYTLQPSPTSAQLAPANSARRGLLISNGANLPAFIRFGTAAATTTAFGLVLPAGGSMLLPAITSAVQVVCAAGLVTVIAGMVSMTELLD